MNFLVLAVLIDSIVVTTVGINLKRTAKREAQNASEAFKKALQEVGPQVMITALQLMQEKETEK
jgi:ribosomal protein S7